jgi:hypothetical protein
MKITKVECIPLLYQYDEPIYDAIFKASHRQALLIKVYTDEGIWGIGEAASFGGPMSSTAEVVEKELAPRIIGEDPFTVERIWRKCYYMSWQHGRGGIVVCAMSGIGTSSAKLPKRLFTNYLAGIAIVFKLTPVVGSTGVGRGLARFPKSLPPMWKKGIRHAK